MLEAQIDAFFHRYQQHKPTLIAPYDAEWRSPCELADKWTDAQGEQWVRWQPVRRHATSDDFAGLERALEMPIHADVKTHYGRYWSSHLDTVAPRGEVSLLYLWNPADVARLIENLIGHAVACLHNRTHFSVFFACAEEDSDLFFTIHNQSGVVQLEAPGRGPLETVAENLEQFMRQLEPAD